MMAGQSETPAVEGVRSLEVRWIIPGPLATAMADWFGRFPVTMESREDAYLLDPCLRGLSVKVRAGGAFEVKVYRGSPGILEVAGDARGRMEYWQKWSFPCAPASQGRADSTSWALVHKRRRISRFPLADRQRPAGLPGLGGEPGCGVELTEVRMREEDWWSLGFEATGPVSALRSQLEATAGQVFASALPGGVEFGTDDSRSYADWLVWRLSVDSDIGA